MRFSNHIGLLPQPVLRPVDHEGSYDGCDFEAKIEINGTVHPHTVDIEFAIVQPDIIDLIQKSKAKVALAVHCDGTYYYELIDIAYREKQTITFDENRVFGNVYFCIVVRAIKDILGFSPSMLKQAFSGLSFDIGKGDTLAVSAEFVENYGLPPMPVGESIFQLDEQKHLQPNEFTVGLDEAKIQVCVGKHLNKLIQENRVTAVGRSKNISSIYFPVLVDVLYRIKGDQTFQGKAWYEAIGSAMSSIGQEVDSSTWEPLAMAQRLFRSPFIDLLEGTD